MVHSDEKYLNAHYRQFFMQETRLEVPNRFGIRIGS